MNNFNGIIDGEIDGHFEIKNVKSIEATEDGFLLIKFEGGSDYTVERIEPQQ